MRSAKEEKEKGASLIVNDAPVFFDVRLLTPDP